MQKQKKVSEARKLAAKKALRQLNSIKSEVAGLRAELSNPAHATIDLNFDQFRLLEPAAKKFNTTVGEIILALAMEQLASSVPGEDGAARVMAALLWRYVRNGKIPTVPYEWKSAGFPTAADNLRIVGGVE